ncbi:MAG: efflux RND transporter periplasmic adaptor subunit [bacterium]|nr:efflux RND transporter periplasmic adaptor subunit [bacterium]
MNFIKRFKLLIILAIIVIIGISYYIFKPKTPPKIDTVKVERTTLRQFVSVVGSVKAAQNVDLAFESSGKVSKVYVNVGSNVLIGDKLAELNITDLEADLQQAQAQVVSAEAGLNQYYAALSAEQARLNEMKSGTRPEEITIAQTNVNNAQSDLNNAKLDLQIIKNKAETDINNLYDDVINTLNDGYLKADNAINTLLDDLFTDTADVKFTFEPNNSNLETGTLNERKNSVRDLASLRSEMDKDHSLNSDYDASLLVGKNSLTVVRNFLNLVGDILDGSTTLTTATLATYKANLNTARTNVNTALTSVSNLQQSISAQKNTNNASINTAESVLAGEEFDLKSAQDQLALKLAGSTEEQINAQEANVKQAEANISSQRAVISQRIASVASAKAKIDKNIIYSPINGVVTKQDAKEGEIVSANVNLISIISEAQFEIEANITEVDISKIKIGDKAEVLLDAYGEDEIFEASVVSVDPAEKVIEGVSTYKTTLIFLGSVDKIRSGMTADLEILTNSLDDVIAVPQRALIVKNGNKIVRTLVGGEVKENIVKTGLRGSDGKIEILEGIKEGDMVITFIEE